MKGHFSAKALLISLLAGTLLLTGCGGGDSTDSPKDPPPIQSDNPTPEPENKRPTVSITGESEFWERQEITLSAVASDEDGSIESYLWEQVSGDVALVLTNQTTSSLSITSPDISDNHQIEIKVTVTDDKGSTAEQTLKVTVKRRVSSVTITGIVTDGPIANAALAFYIGDEQVGVAVADDQGIYSVSLEADEANTESLVKIRAQGGGLNPEVEFISQLTSWDSLIEEAGEDGKLVAEENFGVNITNVTTAEYALITRNKQAPKTEEELKAAQIAVDADEKLRLAALIKIVVDNDDYQLPEGVTSTLDLVDDVETADLFADDVNRKDPELIETTTDEIKNDDDLVDKTIGSIVGEHFLINPKYYSNGARFLTFNSDGTGSITAGHDVGMFKWSQQQSDISIELDAPIVTLQGFENKVIDGNPVQVEIIHQITDIGLSILSEGQAAKSVEYTQISQKVAVDDSTILNEDEFKAELTLVERTQALSISETEFAGTWAIGELVKPTGKLGPATVILNSDGSGTAEFLDEQSLTLNWQRQDTHLTLNVLDEDNQALYNVSYFFIRDINVGYQFAAVVDKQNEEFESRLSLSGTFVNYNPETFSREKVVGHWQVYGGYEFINDYVHYDNYDDGLMHFNHLNDFRNWLVEGDTFTRITYKDYNGEIVNECVVDEDCYVYERVAHQLVAVDNDTLYTLRSFSRYNSNAEQDYYEEALQILAYFEEPPITGFSDYWLNHPYFQQMPDNTYRSYYFDSIYDDEGNEFLRVTLSNEEPQTIDIINGRIELKIAGEEQTVEILSYNRHDLEVCIYAQGSACSDDNKVTWLNKLPEFTLSAVSNGNGFVTPDQVTVLGGDSFVFFIQPNAGYVVDQAVGCEGELDRYSFTIDAVSESCNLEVSFIETPILSVDAGVIDENLAACIDSAGYSRIENVKQLSCSNVTDITGLDSFENLKDLELSNSIFQEKMDFSVYSQLESLNLSGSTISEFDLGSSESLKFLNLEYAALTWLNITNAAPNLEYLNIKGNDLTELDLSNQTKLVSVNARENELTSINIVNSINLTSLDVAFNKLPNLDVTNNTLLTRLIFWENLITEIDLSQNTQLIFIDVDDNPLTALDVTSLTKLETLDMRDTSFASIDLSENLLLKTLYIQNAGITQLDLSNNTKILELYGEFSQFSEIVGLEFIENKTATLDFNNNPLSEDALNYLTDLRDNQGYINLSFSIYIPEFTLNAIAGLNGTISPTEVVVPTGETFTFTITPDEGYQIDTVTGCNGYLDGSLYVTDFIYEACTVEVTFAEVSLSVKAGITDTVLAQCVDETGLSDLSEVTELNCESVTSIQGIASFSNLQNLSLHNGSFGELDLSSSLNLTFLSLEGSSYQGLQFADNTSIRYLNLANTGLTELDVSSFLSLEYLDVRFNYLSSLNVSANAQLEYLDISNNIEFAELDVTQNPMLTHLMIRAHSNGSDIADITTLDLSQNIALQYLDVTGMASTYTVIDLDLSNNTELLVLKAFDIKLRDLDLTNNTKLNRLELYAYGFAELNLSRNTQLKELYLSTDLSELSLRENKQLEVLNLTLSELYSLPSLDLSQNTLLNEINISSSGLSSSQLDFSHNTQLTKLNARGTNLSEGIDLSHNLLLSELDLSDSDIKSLDLSYNTELLDLKLYFTPLNELNLASNSKLEHLDLSYAKYMYGIDISALIKLKTLTVADTPMLNLDVSYNTELQELYAFNTSISEVDLHNNANLINVNFRDAQVQQIMGVENIANKEAVINFSGNPFGNDLRSYLQALRDDSGYINISFLPRNNINLLDGAWYDPSNPDFVIVMRNGDWTHIEKASGSDPAGYEVGYYTYDLGVNIVRVIIEDNTNGSTGFSDISGQEVQYELTDDTLTFNFSSDDSVTLQRLISADSALIGGFIDNFESRSEVEFAAFLPDNQVFRFKQGIGVSIGSYVYDAASGLLTESYSVDELNRGSDPISVAYAFDNQLIWKNGVNANAMYRAKKHSNTPEFYLKHGVELFDFELFGSQDAGHLIGSYLGSGERRSDNVFFNRSVNALSLVMTQQTPDTGIEKQGLILVPIGFTNGKWQLKVFEFFEPEFSPPEDDSVNHSMFDMELSILSGL